MNIKIEIKNVTDEIYPDVWYLIEKLKLVDGVIETGGGITENTNYITFNVENQ